MSEHTELKIDMAVAQNTIEALQKRVDRLERLALHVVGGTIAALAGMLTMLAERIWN